MGTDSREEGSRDFRLLYRRSDWLPPTQNVELDISSFILLLFLRHTRGDERDSDDITWQPPVGSQSVYWALWSAKCRWAH